METTSYISPLLDCQTSGPPAVAGICTHSLGTSQPEGKGKSAVERNEHTNFGELSLFGLHVC